jgi:hypothetical protein
MYASGIPLLDRLTGGLPVGVSDVYGPDSTGKTGLGLCFCREALLRDRSAVFVCPGFMPTTEFLLSAGHQDVLVADCTYGEEVSEIIYASVVSGVTTIVVDSSVNCVPLVEANASVGDHTLAATQNRLLFHTFNSLRDDIKKHRASVILLSQQRVDLSRVPPRRSSSLYGSLRTLLSLRVRVGSKERTAAFGSSEKRTMILHQEFSRRKRGKGPVEAVHYYGAGVNRNLEMLRALKECGKVCRRGSYFMVADELLGPGYAASDKQIDDLQLYGVMEKLLWSK